MDQSLKQYSPPSLAFQLPDSFTRLQVLAEHLLCQDGDECERSTTPMILRHAFRQVTNLAEQLRGEPGSGSDLAATEFLGTLADMQTQLASFWGEETHQHGRRLLRNCDAEACFEVCQDLLRRSPLDGPGWQNLKERLALLLQALPAPSNRIAQLSNLLAPIVHGSWENSRAIDPDEGDAYALAKRTQSELHALWQGLLPHYSFFANVSCLITVWPMQINHAQAVQLHQYLGSVFAPSAPVEGEQGIPPVQAAGTAAASPEPCQETPRWSKITGELFLGTALIRKVRGASVASTIVPILDGFEQAGWPSVIDNPFGEEYGQRRIEALRSLNRGLIQIRFHGAGERGRIRWKQVSATTCSGKDTCGGHRSRILVSATRLQGPPTQR